MNESATMAVTKPASNRENDLWAITCYFNPVGYRRRLAVFELFEVDEEIRVLIRERRDAATLRAAAVARGMKSMFEDGLAKVLLGETTLEEVYRVTV